jgi:hypothetical protein
MFKITKCNETKKYFPIIKFLKDGGMGEEKLLLRSFLPPYT